MGDIAIKIIMALFMKLMTESFLAKFLVYCLQSVSKSTNNKLDDKMVVAIAEALAVKLPTE
jgi:hypothetical protein